MSAWHANVRDLRPMLATLAGAPLQDDRLVYEPKYDGIRALVAIEPRSGAGGIRIWSRLGNDKTGQFPELATDLERFARTLRAPVVLDGEIVALDADGEPAGFQKLQGRINLAEVGRDTLRRVARVAFIAFDILRDGPADLCALPLGTRRARLERVFGTTGSDRLRLSEFVVGDGRALFRTAHTDGWEGLIAKRIESQYKPGRRTTDWRKLKIVHHEEFVIGGWTEPRASRQHFGALLLGVYEDRQAGSGLRTTGSGTTFLTPVGRTKNKEPSARTKNEEPRTKNQLVYVGHTGSGFTGAELVRVWNVLKPLEIAECPFAVRPSGNERPHWVRPVLVAEVKFSEWTDDNKLRHPIYLGLRDDKKPKTVHRERVAVGSPTGDTSQHPASQAANGRGRRAKEDTLLPRSAQTVELVTDLVDQLDEIQARGGDGLLRLPDDGTLRITNLKKAFWPSLKLTKGDLFRYYARVSPYLLPVVADRPLVMKRFPNGIKGKAFYQQRAPDDVPGGVRVEVLDDDHDVPSRLVGGGLKTLLYMTQMAAISQDPWFSRVGSPDKADHVAIDLDPMPGVPFRQILEVARWVHDELRTLHLDGYPKTSGADGLHVYIPLPRGTPYDVGLIFCQIIATMVARKHPKLATVERTVSSRGQKVYVDYLQNIQGKTLASAYSARASDYAGASTPLTWDEIHDGVAREEFTIRTLPDRLARIGDLWAPLLKSKGVNVRAVEKCGSVNR